METTYNGLETEVCNITKYVHFLWRIKITSYTSALWVKTGVAACYLVSNLNVKFFSIELTSYINSWFVLLTIYNVLSEVLNLLSELHSKNLVKTSKIYEMYLLPALWEWVWLLVVCNRNNALCRREMAVKSI